MSEVTSTGRLVSCSSDPRLIAGKPVVNFSFARNQGGRWFVEAQLSAPAKPAPKQCTHAPASDTYVDTLDTAARGTHHCPQCHGTGRYITGIENGAPKFGNGICYRCKGKGRTTEIDRRRNLKYQEHAAARAMA